MLMNGNSCLFPQLSHSRVEESIILFSGNYRMSCIIRKPALFICENKGTDQLLVSEQLIRAFVLAKQILQCLLSKSEISCLWPSLMVVQGGLSRTRLETQKRDFLMMHLI